MIKILAIVCKRCGHSVYLPRNGLCVEVVKLSCAGEVSKALSMSSDSWIQNTDESSSCICVNHTWTCLTKDNYFIYKNWIKELAQ